MIKNFFIPLIFLLLNFLPANPSFSQTTIHLQKESGVYVVPCTVNGLKLRFIFDTGASDVTISLTEAIFMVKNDYLKENDIFGVTYAQLANGDITKNTRINLREIEFAGLKLYNIKALIVHELSAPLLLGQSAFSQLGTFQLDPVKNTLTILRGKNTSYNSTGKTSEQDKTVKDIDGNVYNTVTIGTQGWIDHNFIIGYKKHGFSVRCVRD